MAWPKPESGLSRRLSSPTSSPTYPGRLLVAVHISPSDADRSLRICLPHTFDLRIAFPFPFPFLYMPAVFHSRPPSQPTISGPQFLEIPARCGAPMFHQNVECSPPIHVRLLSSATVRLSTFYICAFSSFPAYSLAIASPRHRSLYPPTPTPHPRPWLANDRITTHGPATLTADKQLPGTGPPTCRCSDISPRSYPPGPSRPFVPAQSSYCLPSPTPSYLSHSLSSPPIFFLQASRRRFAVGEHASHPFDPILLISDSFSRSRFPCPFLGQAVLSSCPPMTDPNMPPPSPVPLPEIPAR